MLNLSRNRTQNNSEKLTAYIVMAISMIFASAFSVFPLNHTLANLRPLFLFVTMIFWVIHRPEYFGVWFAFVVGLCSDLLLDTHIGQQAFSGVLATFVMQYVTKDSRKIPDLMVWVLASLATVVFSLSLLLLQYIDGQVVIWRNGLPMLTSILSWPLISILLRRF